MTAAEHDEWSVGVVNGLANALSRGWPYPTGAASFVYQALTRVERRKLGIAPEAIRIAQDWLKAVTEPRPCKCKCHKKHKEV